MTPNGAPRRFEGTALLALIAAGAFLAHGGPVMARLGFYHDDWALLLQMRSFGDGLSETLAGMLADTHLFRPLSAFCWTIPYHLFGLQPLPWHLLMAALTAASGWAFHSALRGLGAPPRPAAAAVLLYLAFPNKDATLFWPAVSLLQTTSLLCLLLSFVANLRYVEFGGAARLGLSGALFAAALCTYEQGFFLAPLWLLAPAAGEQAARRRHGLIMAAAATALFALYRFAILPRFVAPHKSLGASPGHFFFVYYMALRSVLDPRWLAYLARIAWQGLLWNPLLALCAAAVPWAAWRLSAAEPVGHRTAARLAAWGLGVYLLANLPFAFSDYAPAAYDHMNRLNQLPALGLAALGCAAALAWPARAWLLTAAASLSLALSPAFAEIWAESYRRQLEVRDAVLRRLDDWPPERPLLLRLPELYAARKAPVFLAGYDISSAIMIWTGQRDRRAFVHGSGAQPGPDALETASGPIPYGSAMLLDMEDGRLSRLDRRRARALPPPVEPWQTPLRLW